LPCAAALARAKAVCAAHSAPSARPCALGPVARCPLAAALGPSSLRAPPGARRRVPLRLPGSACRGGPRPRPRAAPSPRRPRCASGCGLRRLGPARCAPGRRLGLRPLGPCPRSAASSPAPVRRLAAPGPPSRVRVCGGGSARPRCPCFARRLAALAASAPAALRLPSVLPAGGLGGAAPRCGGLRPPAAGVWGVPRLRARESPQAARPGGGDEVLITERRQRSCAWPAPPACWRSRSRCRTAMRRCGMRLPPQAAIVGLELAESCRKRGKIFEKLR